MVGEGVFLGSCAKIPQGLMLVALGDTGFPTLANF